MKRKSILTAIATLAVAVLASCATTNTAKPKGTCPVTGNRLGSMGDPVSTVYNGKKIWLCCKPCIKKFHKDPQRYLASAR